MSEGKHTPADQWQAHVMPYLKFSTVTIGNASMEIKTPNHAADAKVAAAAPDLLEACLGWIKHMESPTASTQEQEDNLLDKMRAAIAKATS